MQLEIRSFQPADIENVSQNCSWILDAKTQFYPDATVHCSCRTFRIVNCRHGLFCLQNAAAIGRKHGGPPSRKSGSKQQKIGKAACKPAPTDTKVRSATAQANADCVVAGDHFLGYLLIPAVHDKKPPWIVLIKVLRQVHALALKCSNDCMGCNLQLILSRAFRQKKRLSGKSAQPG